MPYSQHRQVLLVRLPGLLQPCAVRLIAGEHFLCLLVDRTASGSVVFVQTPAGPTSGAPARALARSDAGAVGHAGLRLEAAQIAQQGRASGLYVLGRCHPARTAMQASTEIRASCMVLGLEPKAHDLRHLVEVP